MNWARALVGVAAVGSAAALLMLAGPRLLEAERWFNQLDAPTDGKEDPDTLRDRISIRDLRWAVPDQAAHVVGRIELFNGNAFAVRDMRLTCMRTLPDGSFDTRQEIRAVVTGPLAPRTRQWFSGLDLGDPPKGATGFGCIVARVTKDAGGRGGANP